MVLPLFCSGVWLCMIINEYKTKKKTNCSKVKLYLNIQLFRETLSEKSTKLHKPIPKDSMGRRIELLNVLNTNEI